MPESDSDYFINNPVFLKYKRRFDLFKFRSSQYLKSVFINERIIEIPFALGCLNTLPAGSKVLDLGCTESIFPLQAATLGYQVTGFDFRKYPYVHPNLIFVQGDTVNLPFESETFEAVFCISTIEHIGLGFYNDPLAAREGADQKAMKQVHRVLKKGGMLALTVPYGTEIANDHHRIYNQQSLRQLLADFAIQEERYFVNEGKNNSSQSNFWQETAQAKAAQVVSGDSANCVCLIKALK
jgi:ubiquinone/menaquinone biosynthesis C-methylase UbiE